MLPEYRDRLTQRGLVQSSPHPSFKIWRNHSLDNMESRSWVECVSAAPPFHCSTASSSLRPGLRPKIDESFCFSTSSMYCCDVHHPPGCSIPSGRLPNWRVARPLRKPGKCTWFPHPSAHSNGLSSCSKCCAPNRSIGARVFCARHPVLIYLVRSFHWCLTVPGQSRLPRQETLETGRAIRRPSLSASRAENPETCPEATRQA